MTCLKQAGFSALIWREDKALCAWLCCVSKSHRGPSVQRQSEPREDSQTYATLLAFSVARSFSLITPR